MSLNDIEKINNILKEKGYLGLTSLKAKPLNTLKKNKKIGWTASGIGGTLLTGLNTAAVLATRVNPLLAVANAPAVAKELSAPAYRVTIPVVCIVAMLRIKYQQNKQQHDEF